MNHEAELKDIYKLLEEIRDNQKRQLEQQESLAIQKEQVRVFLEHQEKAQRIQDRAESIQDRSAVILSRARRIFPFVLAAIAGLLIYVTWLLWRVGFR